MKTKFGFLAVLLILILAAGSIIGCSGGSKTPPGENKKADVIELKLGHVCAIEHPYNYASQHFADLVKEKSNGRINVTIFPSAQLGGDRDMIEQIQNGSLDMGAITGCVFGGFTPLIDGTQLPFVIENYDLLDKAIPSKESDALLAGLDDIGLKGLAIYDCGLRYLVMTDKPINTIADIKGKKIRVSEAPVLVDIFKAVGASPTPMPYGEIYSGLQTGVLDGIEMDLSAIVAEKHYEVAKYVTESGHYTWPFVLTINQKKFESFSAEDQKILLDAASETTAFNHANVRELDQKSIDFLKTKGVKFNTLTDKAEFKQAEESVIAKYVAKDPRIKAFVDMVNGLK